jgi:RNA polymerase sigma-70 factor (ECF subfamily)
MAPERAADHIDRLYRLAVALCGSPHDAEDLVQEAYARVLARPRRLHGTDEFPYLARIVRNLVYDHHRRRAATADPAADWEEPADTSAASDPETLAHARELCALVRELPDGQRDVVAAVDVAGLSYRQAASALGVPVGTVMSRLARGRSRLAAALG